MAWAIDLEGNWASLEVSWTLMMSHGRYFSRFLNHTVFISNGWNTAVVKDGSNSALRVLAMFMCIFPIKVNLGTLCCQVVLYIIWWLEVFFKHCTIIINLPLLPFLFCDFSLCVISNVNILPVYFLTSFLAPLFLSAPPPHWLKSSFGVWNNRFLVLILLFSIATCSMTLHTWSSWARYVTRLLVTPPRCNMKVCLCVREGENRSPGLVEEKKTRETTINHSNHLQLSSPLTSMLTATLTLQNF